MLNNSKHKKVLNTIIFLICAFCAYSQTWSNLGEELNGNPSALYVHNNKLYVGGWFDTAEGISANYIASWDCIHWNSLGTGAVNGVPLCFSSYNNELYAGGSFLNMGGVTNSFKIARWDGSTWYSAGNTTIGSNTEYITSMAVYNGALYAGGNITTMGGVNVYRIGKWNGTIWSNPGGGVTGGFGLINCMAVYNNQLYVGGSFSYAGGVLSQYIARWNGTQWDSVGSALSALNDEPFSMVVDTISNVLYVGGSFTMAGGMPAKYIAKWNGTNWSSIGNPITQGAIVMEMYHNELYVGCVSAHAQVADTIIARWNGDNWYHVQGPNNTVSALEVYKDTLYAGGDFTMVGTTPANYIAKWFSPDNTSVKEKKSEVEYLGNNIPNPFNNSTFIPYFVPTGSKATLKIYGSNGEPIKTYIVSEGSNKLQVSLAEYSNGLYFYTLTIDDGRIIRHKKMILNK